ncbi:Protein of unknown function [Pyronema omphalodes CBS 100304]|uniref:Uncharacterized protein n=1 Tax=Pyronema omphalodes (strain CBS 100304) TaxID=1076935 RepID=U4L7Q5_PYROM|nr:Protein of unknown function [Pyronema omphalodes CBS 100304]
MLTITTNPPPPLSTNRI